MAQLLHWIVLFLYLSPSNVFSAIFHQSDHVTAHLITDVVSIKPGGSISVGILLEVEEGWHTYWLNPGDSGLPIAITWKLPSGFIAGDIQWPYPAKFGTDSIVNYGYEQEVLLITDLQASPSIKLGDTISIEADVEWLVCKDECLPGSAELTLRVPVKDKEPAPDPVWAKRFAETRKRWPIGSTEWPVRAVFEKNYVHLSIHTPAWFEEEIEDISFFPEQLAIFEYSAPQIFEKTENGYILRAKISSLARSVPLKLLGVLVFDKSWSRDSDNRALRIAVPLSQNREKIKSKKEVSR